MTDQELFEYAWVPAIGYLIGVFSSVNQINLAAQQLYTALVANNSADELIQAGKRIKNILTQENKGSLIVDLTGLKNGRTLEDDIMILSRCVSGHAHSFALEMPVTVNTNRYVLDVNTYACACRFIVNYFAKSKNYIILDDICATKFEAVALLDLTINGNYFVSASAYKLSNGDYVISEDDLPDTMFDNTGLLNKSALNTTSTKQQNTTASTPTTTAKTSKWKNYGPLGSAVTTFSNAGFKEDLSKYTIGFIAINPYNGSRPNRTTNRLNIRPLTANAGVSSTPEKLYLNSARDYNCFTCFVIVDNNHDYENEKLLDFCSKKFHVDRSALAIYFVKPKKTGYFALSTEAGVDVYVEASSLNEALKRTNTPENISFVESIVDSNEADWVDYVQKTMD